jgi:hypothetical protein
MLVAALLILAVEGVLLVRYYSGIAPSSAQTSEGTMPEGTVLKEPTAALADASIKATEATAPDERDDDEEASFVHRATGANSRGDYTYLDHPSINGDPDAVVLVVPASSRRNAGGDAYGHNIGVWYEPGERKWAVFNQDLAPVPAGSAFGVVVPPAGRGFVHRAASPNTVGNATYLDNPLTNGEPSAEVSVTQNWNPGGGNGVYNDRPVGVLYDEDVGKWLVYNEDDFRMPEGAAFNVAASGAVDPAR